MNVGCVDGKSAQPFALFGQFKVSQDMGISFSVPTVNGRTLCLAYRSRPAECGFNRPSGVMFVRNQDIRQFGMHDTATVTFEPSKAKILYGSVAFNGFTVLCITNAKRALTVRAQR